MNKNSKISLLLASFVTFGCAGVVPAFSQEDIFPDLTLEPEDFLSLATPIGSQPTTAVVMPEVPVVFDEAPIAPGRTGAPMCSAKEFCHGLFGVLSGPLALTDDQYEKIYTVKNGYLDKAGPQMVELFNLRRQLKNCLTSSDLDNEKARLIASKISSLKAELNNQRMDKMIALANVLTPDQRKAIRQAMIKRRGMSNGRDMFMHRG